MNEFDLGLVSKKSKAIKVLSTQKKMSWGQKKGVEENKAPRSLQAIVELDGASSND